MAKREIESITVMGESITYKNMDQLLIHIQHAKVKSEMETGKRKSANKIFLIRMS
jgi:hypothetical protein